MAERRLQNILLRGLPVLLLPAMVLGISSCSVIEDIIMSEIQDDRRSRTDDDKNGGLGDETTETGETTRTHESLEPSGTYTTAPLELMDIDAEFVEDALVYSVWYDATEDNPVNYSQINSQDAFALKGVFYFNTPLTTVFEARLVKDGEVLLTKNVTLKDNVTAECDFSAGMEGWGVFEAGNYVVELYFDGEYIAATGEIEVC